jgi:transposase
LACCCGLDVHSRQVTACLLTRADDGATHRDLQVFPSTTAGLLRLSDWLGAAGCTHVGMESTGSFWKPLYNLLEDHFTLVVANPAHLRFIPGRKTDMKDAEWIALLLQRGMLPKSAIPSRQERELRELTRYRTALVRERTSEINRIHKVLVGANIQLGTVASNVVGASGMAMLRDIIAGVDDPRLLAARAKGRLRERLDDLEEALLGLVGQHQRTLLRIQLGHIADLDARVAEVELALDERLRPFEEVIERLDTIPGVGRTTAAIILAEVGTDLRHFASADQLASWAGVCPGRHESAGKERSRRSPKGSRHLRAALTEAGQAAGRSHSSLGQRYRRLHPRIGKKRAGLANGHSILKICVPIIRDGVTYEDRFFAIDEEKQRQILIARHLKALTELAPHLVISTAQAP